MVKIIKNNNWQFTSESLDEKLDAWNMLGFLWLNIPFFYWILLSKLTNRRLEDPHFE